MFWRLKSKVILLIILETIDFIVKSIFIVGVCKIGGYVLNYLCSILIYMYFFLTSSTCHPKIIFK